jgi:hypothetical protein
MRPVRASALAWALFAPGLRTKLKQARAFTSTAVNMAGGQEGTRIRGTVLPVEQFHALTSAAVLCGGEPQSGDGGDRTRYA